MRSGSRTLRQRVHAGAQGKLLGRLGAAMQHDDQWHQAFWRVGRDVQPVGAVDFGCGIRTMPPDLRSV
jgi:hypothetical protein